MLAVHRAHRVPVHADMHATGMGITPRPLDRLAGEDTLPARGKEQRIDRLDQEPHAECLAKPVAQPEIGVGLLASLGCRRGLFQRVKDVSRAASIEPVASATRLCTVANSAMRLLPPATAPRVVRTLAISMKSSSAPSAIPRIGATSANGSADIIDWRYSGLSWTAPPGDVPLNRSTTGTTRCAGTNTFSATVFLLPVPARPIVNQLSSKCTSARGSRKKAGVGGTPSLAGGIIPPRKSHWA